MAALTSGSSRCQGLPGLLSRSNYRDLQRTSSTPIAMSTAARLKLNATIRANPRPIRPRPMAMSMTPNASGQGTSPPETPIANRSLGRTSLGG